VGLLYWNKPDFEEAGLDPEVPPETLDQVMEYSDQLTVRDQGGEITRLGFHIRLEDAYWPAIFDAHYWDPETEEITPTDPGMVAALEWEAAWYAHYGIEAVDRFLAGIPDYYSAAQPLCTDVVAMHGGYEWDWLFLGLGCELDKFGYAKFPTPAGHPEYPTSSQGAIALVIPTGAKQPEMGWKFIEYLETWEATATICAGLVNVAQVKDAVNLPEYRDHPVLKFASDLSLNTRAWPGYIPVAAEYATELAKARDLIAHGKVSAEEGLQAVYDMVQPALNEALGKA
jgi:multiple sugar transport system substrate-binding protein